MTFARRFTVVHLLSAFLAGGIAVVAFALVMRGPQGSFSSVGPADPAFIAKARHILEEANISTVERDGLLLVNVSKRNEAMLLLAQHDLLGHDSDGPPLAGNLPPTDLRTTEALKSELRRMIMTYQFVRDVRLSVPVIVPPERTASLVIDLDPRYEVSDSHLANIRNLVRSAFPDLDTRNIYITDQKGTSL